jgi:hypothetical protein
MEELQMEGERNHGKSQESGSVILSALFVTLLLTFMLLSGLLFLERIALSGSFIKRHRDVRGAVEALSEFVIRDMIPKVLSGRPLSSVLSGLILADRESINQVITDTCFSKKLSLDTWMWEECSGSDDPEVSPDVRFTLVSPGSERTFDIFLRLQDTASGNSDISNVELEGSGVAEGQGVIAPVKHRPYIYRVNLRGKVRGGTERSEVTVLLAY